MLDAETKITLDALQTGSKVSSDNIAQISSTYRQTLANNLIHLIDEKLVYYEHTLTSTKCLYRIVVPSSLRRDILQPSMPYQQQGMWGNTRPFIGLSSDISGPAFVRTSRNIRIATLRTNGVVEAVNYCSLGPSVLHLQSYM